MKKMIVAAFISLLSIQGANATCEDFYYNLLDEKENNTFENPAFGVLATHFSLSAASLMSIPLAPVFLLSAGYYVGSTIERNMLKSRWLLLRSSRKEEIGSDLIDIAQGADMPINEVMDILTNMSEDESLCDGSIFKKKRRIHKSTRYRYSPVIIPSNRMIIKHLKSL